MSTCNTSAAFWKGLTMGDKDRYLKGVLATWCQWFALCPNKATGTLAHPILGDVPICDRCRKLATDQS